MRLWPIFFILTACTDPTSIKNVIDESASARKEIIETDIRMSKEASRNGFHTTLLLFADDSLIKPTEGEIPVIGKKALIQYYEGEKDVNTITWFPTKAEAARSGELGYSFGNWEYAAKDTTYYGNYYTIWKKQPEGNWKWVVDGGNNSPAPVK
jgi:ketosteroid isomerase-like protein